MPHRPKRLPALLIAALCLMPALPAPQADTPVQLQSERRDLQAREYYLRVGVEQEARALRVTPLAECRILDRHGRILFEPRPGHPLRILGRETRAAGTGFYFILGQFTSDQAEQAHRLADRARRTIGKQVRLIEDPDSPAAPSPLTGAPYPGKQAVAVGPFRSKDEAWRHKTWNSDDFNAELIEIPLPAGGELEVRNAAGQRIAHAEGYLLFLTDGPEPNLRGGACPPDGTRWKSSAAWKDDPAYRGALEVRIAPSGRLTLVNRVFIEHYLMGVLPPEIGSHAPPEMKKVQAVISRSEAIAKLRQRRFSSLGFDHDNSQLTQVYRGADVETPSCNEAVRETWGQVAVHRDSIIDAVYSLCCGGMTAANEDAWGGRPLPYLRSRLDTENGPWSRDYSRYEKAREWIDSQPGVYCNPAQPGYPRYARKYFRWSERRSAAELLESLRQAGHRTGSRVTDIAIALRTRSGLIRQVRLEFAGRSPLVIEGEYKIRKALGGLPSAFFVLDRDYDGSGRLRSVRLDGAGCGHGVGLCQMGATMMARKGYDYIHILGHYYRNAEVYRIYR